MRKLIKIVFNLITGVVFPVILCAQPQSHNISGDNVNYSFLSSYQINIDDFLRTNDSNIGMGNRPVDIELTWGHPMINNACKSVVLQVELKTSKFNNEQIPLNVCLVIDRSASMSENQRMDKVKLAMKEFFKMLRPNDYASIVIYDDYATLLLPAQKIDKSKHAYVSNLIDSIKLGASTNMVGGMLLGYKEVLKNYNQFSANRVILLTDGITNVGITEPEIIIAESKAFNERGIDISTIGIGTDINFSLLDNIAYEGRGLCHFIGDRDSVRNNAVKVFQEEFNNMLSVVKEPVLEITFPKQLSACLLKDTHPTYVKRSISIPLKNLHQEMVQTCLIEFKVDGKLNKDIEVTAKLAYFDASNREKAETETKCKHLLFSDKCKKNIDILGDHNVKNNYYLTLMANILKKSVWEFEGKRYTTAYQTINECLFNLKDKIDLSENTPQYDVYQMLTFQQQIIGNALRKKGR